MPGGESGESLLAAFGLPAEDPGRLATFYEELGFFRLKKELLDAAGLAPAATTVETSTEVDTGGLPVWETAADALDAFLARAAEAGLAGLHVECAPGRPFPPEPIALVAAVPGGGLVASPLAGDGDGAGRAFLARLFSEGRVEIVAHESKRLHLAAAALAMDPPRRVFDTMLAAYVDGPGLHAHDLAGDARAFLGRDPATVPSPTEAAAFSVIAVSVSSTVSPIPIVAKNATAGSDSVYEEPGLQSVPRAIATPAVTISRAGAYRFIRRKTDVPGRSVATTPAFAMAWIPSGWAKRRWSAERAPTSAARRAPPRGVSSSAWSRGRRPQAFPASRILRDSSSPKTPCSQKTSTKRAPSAARAGRISSQHSAT